MAVDESKKYPFMFFTDVNRRVNPYVMKDNELFDSINFWTEDHLGAKKVRPGYTKFLDQMTAVVVSDKYSEANQNTSNRVYSYTNNDYHATGQSFMGNGGVLNAANFFLSKTGSPTGNGVAKIYAHTGTYGTSSLPTGSALATSDNFDVSTLSSSTPALITLKFSGVNKITLTNNTPYIVTFEYSGGSNNDWVNIYKDTTTPTAAGNEVRFEDVSSWVAVSGEDCCFYVFTELAEPVTGLFYMKFPDQTKRLVATAGASIFAVDPTTASSWGSPKLSIYSGNPFLRPEATSLNALIHIVSQMSPTDSHYIEGTSGDVYTDTTYTSGTDPVVPYRALTCCTYHRRVYVGSPYDTSLYASEICYSSIDYQAKGSDPASPWTTQATLSDYSFAFNLPVDKDYHGSVLHLTSINDRCLVYKEEAIYVWNETSILDVFGISPIQGSIATMQETKEDYFLTNEGFFKCDGQKVSPVGEGWYEMIKQIFRNTDVVLDPTKIISYAGNFLYFCFLGDVGYDGNTIKNACFVYNAYYNEMYLWSMGHQITAIGSYINAQKDKVFVFGDVNGNTYQLDYTANDDYGTSIQAHFDTKYFFFDSPESYNEIRELYNFATKGSGMEVSVDRDFARSYDVPYAQLDTIQSKDKKDPSITGQFKTLSFRVSWNGKGARPEFYGMIAGIWQASERKESTRK